MSDKEGRKIFSILTMLGYSLLYIGIFMIYLYSIFKILYLIYYDYSAGYQGPLNLFNYEVISDFLYFLVGTKTSQTLL